MSALPPFTIANIQWNLRFVRRSLSFGFPRCNVSPSVSFRVWYVTGTATGFTFFVDEIIRGFSKDECREIRTRVNRSRTDCVATWCQSMQLQVRRNTSLSKGATSHCSNHVHVFRLRWFARLNLSIGRQRSEEYK